MTSSAEETTPQQPTDLLSEFQDITMRCGEAGIPCVTIIAVAGQVTWISNAPNQDDCLSFLERGHRHIVAHWLKEQAPAQETV